MEGTMRKVKVHLFDDDLTNLNLLAAILSGRNYEVQVFNRADMCPDGNQTDKCPNSNPCADIVITATQIPGISASEMLSLQTQRGCPVDIRNLAIASADFDNEEQQMIEESGCALFRKPLQINGLLAWLDDCKQRIDLSKPVGIMRKHTRHSVNIDVVYTYSSGGKLQNGTVLNFSDNGLCLKAYTHLMEKQSITIQTELPNGCTKAAVRWIKQMGADSFLTGLMAQ
jgi:DNA-binding response OmpR family regulator